MSWFWKVFDSGGRMRGVAHWSLDYRKYNTNLIDIFKHCWPFDGSELYHIAEWRFQPNTKMSPSTLTLTYFQNLAEMHQLYYLHQCEPIGGNLAHDHRGCEQISTQAITK